MFACTVFPFTISFTDVIEMPQILVVVLRRAPSSTTFMMAKLMVGHLLIAVLPHFFPFWYMTIIYLIHVGYWCVVILWNGVCPHGLPTSVITKRYVHCMFEFMDTSCASLVAFAFVSPAADAMVFEELHATFPIIFMITSR